MSQGPDSPQLRGHTRALRLRHFQDLVAEFRHYRLDPDLARMDESERVLAFVRGLRLSARLIYAIRQMISKSDLEAHWGHILSADGEVCSRECDVIIHRPGECDKWNGNDEPVMDFRFIDYDQALAVVSCKSKFTSFTREEVRYCADVKRYVDTVHLFAECCYEHRASDLRDQVLAAGYDGFWYLYTIDEKTDMISCDETKWLTFVDAMREIAADVGVRSA